MNDERLKQAFDKMTPDTQSEKRMLAGIIRKGESHTDCEFTVEPVKPSRWAAIPAVMAILAMIALSVFVAVRFDRNRNTANDPTQEHDTVPNRITESDTHLESEVPPDHEDSPEPMTIPSYGERPPITVYPLPSQPLDFSEIENSTLSVSVVSVTDSIYGNEIEVEVFVVDGYDAKDVMNLQAGDTIVIGSETVEIDDIVYYAVSHHKIMVDINGGIGSGYNLIPSDGYDCEGDFIVNCFSDENLWNSIGIVTLPVSQDFIFTDATDSLDSGPVYTFEDFVYDKSLRENGFTHYNTTIVIEDGVVTQMHRY